MKPITKSLSASGKTESIHPNKKYFPEVVVAQRKKMGTSIEIKK